MITNSDMHAVDRVFLPFVEFYITNICNFNCQGCNRFNNFAFAGSSKWVDHKDVYRLWSERLDFGYCSVLGGEPMTNPDYKDWIKGIHALWPNKKIKLVTNGSLLVASDRDLYDLFESDPEHLVLDIGLHNKFRLESILQTLDKWLTQPIAMTRVPKEISKIEGAEQAWRESYQKIRGPDWPEFCEISQWQFLPEWIQQECETFFNFTPEIFLDSVRKYELIDANGVTVTVAWENFFHQGALKINKDTHSFNLHNSDPIKAHHICHSKKCHHFEKGKLYKCGQVSLMRQFYDQFFLELDQHDLALINSYEPATIDMSMPTLKQWIADLDQPMPQCKFCPESYQMSEIFSEAKKIHFTKKKKS